MDNQAPNQAPKPTRPSQLQLLQADIIDAVAMLVKGQLSPQALASYMQMSFTRGANDAVSRMMKKELDREGEEKVQYFSNRQDTNL